MMGRVWSFDASWDVWAMSMYGTVTSLSESPLVEGLLYAGTDDGRIHVSENGGETWRAVERLPDVTDDFFVNDIKADLHDPDTVYVVVDDHKSGDFAPYILRSDNRGRTWTSISEELPERHIVWRLVQDHEQPGLLFAGTEFGVFFTPNGGAKWVKLSGGAPTIPFRDLVIQTRENDLVGATFGRGFWILDDYTPLRHVSEAKLQEPALLFPVRDALWYIPSRPLGDFEVHGKSSQGDSYFVAPNPPFGAVFTYYLADDLQTARERRREQEKKLAGEGADTPYPGWDAIRQEEIEEPPAILLTVRNADGNVVRRLEGPVSEGFHRVAWDLRYPLSSPWTAEKSTGQVWIHIPGPLAAPGTYSVSLAKRINGVTTELGMSQTFRVVPMRERGLAGATPAEVAAFELRLDDLKRRVNGAGAAVQALLTEMGAVKETLMRSAAPLELRDRARAFELELLAMQQTLAGNEARDLYNDLGPVSIKKRVDAARAGTFLSTYGPTPTHIRSVEIAEAQFGEVEARLRQLNEAELPELRNQLDASGVPWTPGRAVPATD
jgi:hypothetical protein